MSTFGQVKKNRKAWASGQDKSWYTKSKEVWLRVTAQHLVQTKFVSLFACFCLETIEAGSLLWLIIHPLLNQYASNSFAFDTVATGLKYLNIYQLLQDQDAVFLTLGLALGLLLFQGAALAHSVWGVLNKQPEVYFKYLKKIVNLQFIVGVHVLHGPLLGLAVNIFFCNAHYSYFEECYSEPHIICCVLAAIIVISIVLQTCFFALFYFDTDPFSKSSLGYPNRNYLLFKNALKLLLPLCLSASLALGMEHIYSPLVVLLLGAYLFFLRLCSPHSFNANHFYFELFLEVFLFWMSLCSLLNKYTGEINANNMSFVYALICSVMASAVIVRV